MRMGNERMRGCMWLGVGIQVVDEPGDMALDMKGLLVVEKTLRRGLLLLRSKLRSVRSTLRMKVLSNGRFRGIGFLFVTCPTTQVR